ncbi:MAG: type IV pilus biogenesis/stability protein PilW [Casimicrobium sp.]
MLAFRSHVSKSLVTSLTALLALLALGGCAGMKKPGENADEGTQSSTGTSNENPARYRARLHTELGANYLQRGQYAVALEELREAVRVDPRYGLAHSITGLVHANLNEDAKADAAFKRAVEVAPDEGDIRNQYGSFLCGQGRADEGIAQFEAALRQPLYQTPQVALENAGSCALAAAKIRQAENYFNRLVQNFPFNSRGYQGLAAVALKTARFDEVKKQVELGMRTQQITPQLLFYGACAEKKLGNKPREDEYRAQLKTRFADSPFNEAMDKGGCE